MLLETFCEKQEEEEDEHYGFFARVLPRLPRTRRYFCNYVCNLLDSTMPSVVLVCGCVAYMGKASYLITIV